MYLRRLRRLCIATKRRRRRRTYVGVSAPRRQYEKNSAAFPPCVSKSSLKSSNGFTRLVPSLIVAAGYAGAFFFLSLTLRTMPIGVAYAIWSGAGVVLLTLVGLLVYRQSLDAAALVGMGLIVAGVVIIHLYSKAEVR